MQPPPQPGPASVPTISLGPRFHALPAAAHRYASAHPETVLLETSRRSATSPVSYLLRDPVEILTAHTLAEIPGLLHRLEQSTDQGFHAAGYFTYEAGFVFEPTALLPGYPLAPGPLLLAWFGLYSDPLVFDHRTGRFNAPTPWLDLSPSEPAASFFPPTEPVLGINLAEYVTKIEQIKRLIESGDTYQVNFTSSVTIPLPSDTAALFAHLMRSQPVEFGAFLNLGHAQVLSASPELFFRRHGDDIAMRPMKGTAPRGLDLREDHAHAVMLAADAKNRSENLMIVDLLRNDLGRVCRHGTVDVTDMFQVETYPTVLQMTSTIHGKLRPEITVYDLFRSLFPSGSITGAPKIRSMQIIRSLEQRPRGIYTGAIGLLSPGRRAVFSVAIRTLVIEGERAGMGVGSGIVYDSNPVSEFEECRTKAAFLSRSSEPFDLIETLLWTGAELTFLDEHLDRIQESAAYFDFAADPEQIRADLQRHARALQPPGNPHRVRLLLSPEGLTHITATPLPAEPLARGDASVPPGIAVELAPQRTDSHDPFLRHKTTRRDLYDRSIAEARTRGLADYIFQNEVGHLTEGAIHNLFVVKAGKWLTPPLSAGVLPGIYRAHILQTRNAEETTLTPSDLESADELYLANSVRGLRRITRIGRRPQTLLTLTEAHRP